VYCFDERARPIEILDVNNKRSMDGSGTLMMDPDMVPPPGSNTFNECFKIDLRCVHKETTAMLLYLEGGPRNFQFVQSVRVETKPISSRGAGGVLLPGQGPPPAIFQFEAKTKKDYQGLALCVLYKDGWLPDAPRPQEGLADATIAPPVEEATAVKKKEQKPQFVTRVLMEPVYTSTKKGKDERCLHLVVDAVPSLEKYRPRLFGNVRDVCSALSSLALPQLKKKFTDVPGGLRIAQFTEVIYKQLYTTHPKIAEPNESGYTVAMIEEMFHQIDFNGDGGADWDEFTTFCIQTASAGKGGGGGDGGPVASHSLDEYVIEYGEDITLRDKLLSPHRPVTLMKYFPEPKRFAIIPDDAEQVLIFDDKFKLRSQLSPYNLPIPSGKREAGSKESSNNEVAAVPSQKIMIYDIEFLSGKDLYVFCSSDHAITIIKEQGSVGGRKVAHVLYARIYHGLIHLKLCWSPHNKLLCSVASDRVIYGWDIDKPLPLFQISRHSDIITDFISIDHLDIFVTCSMDKRIVLWSAITRRVKGILIGHKRGVRCLSAYESTLLSAGFELDARTWDLVSKENVAILRGHRQPITAAKLMCELSSSEKDYRAITVDEGGELRLWNIYVKERTSDPVAVPTLQMFEIHNPTIPLKYLRFLAIPNHGMLSQAYYSNVVACSAKLFNFVPEKNSKEFVPPSCCLFNEATAELATAVAKSLLKYDVCTGAFSSVFVDLHTADITAICLDGERGRRMFCGCGNGDVLLVNYQSGAIIEFVSPHTKEITGICSHQGTRNNIYSGGMDGRLVMIEEASGALHIHNVNENAFGENVGISDIKLIPSIACVVAVSVGMQWGVWNSSTFKRILIIKEEGIVLAVEPIGKYTHTHTHTHTHTLVSYTHIYTHIHTYTLTYTNMHTYMLPNTHTHTHTHRRFEGRGGHRALEAT